MQRSFIRSDNDLRLSAAAGGSGDDDDDDDEELPRAVLSTVPAKRNHSGNVKVHASDGKLIAAFWARVAFLWKQKNKAYGTDLKSDGWTGCVRLL
jgi:hypothetical protein